MRARIYDLALMGLTPRWYRRVLSRLPPGATMLDIGIGTGGALVRNADVVRDKRIRVVGIDIDRDYLAQARRNLTKAGLTDLVQVHHQSVYDHQGGPYQAAYFSASFMLLPDPSGALKQVMGQLTPDGRVYFTQTFHTRRSPWLEKLKPMLHRVTTIHFGRVTYESDFVAEVSRAGLHLQEMTEMGSKGAASYRLVVGTIQPQPGSDAG